MNPAPEQIRQCRSDADLSQTAAAALIHSTKRTWQDWEHGIAAMHPGLWELFISRTGLAGHYLGGEGGQESPAGQR